VNWICGENLERGRANMEIEHIQKEKMKPVAIIFIASLLLGFSLCIIWWLQVIGVI
jgi:hypothetical protein